MAYITFQPSDHFITHLYTGNDSTNNQTSLGMTPDLVWVKCRNNSTPSHYWVDKVRGDKKYISSNLTASESTDSNTFDLVSGGFNLAGGNGWTNVSGRTYASWNWKAGGSQGSSNTDGTINTTYTSVNTTAGFSISKFVGTGANATVGHGLGVAPSMYIVKKLDSSGSWGVYHKSLGATKSMFLDLADSGGTHVDYWNNTEPTSSVFSVGISSTMNHSGQNMIAYCFAEKTGFSKFGSYIGNGNAAGPFIYTGFKPAFFLVKNYTSGTGESWHMYDNKRLGYNPAHSKLIPNNNSAEAAETKIDFLSNGIKIRSAGDGHLNQNTKTYLYMAFAEEPLVSSNNIPATAR